MTVLGLGFHPGPGPGLDADASHNCPTGHSMGLREHWWPGGSAQGLDRPFS